MGLGDLLWPGCRRARRSGQNYAYVPGTRPAPPPHGPTPPRPIFQQAAPWSAHNPLFTPRFASVSAILSRSLFKAFDTADARAPDLRAEPRGRTAAEFPSAVAATRLPSRLLPIWPGKELDILSQFLPLGADHGHVRHLCLPGPGGQRGHPGPVGRWRSRHRAPH
jgi:hypothetical protein